ncbi:MAG TPA: tetratricopeptide repeat protein [Desulfuromonadaceae bacterium]
MIAQRRLTIFSIMIVAISIHLGASISIAGVDEAFSALANRDYAKALNEFKILADQGNAAAQYNLAVMNKNGKGVPQNYVEAAKWFRMAADQGHVRAQYNMAMMCFKGQGVPQDYLLAHMWANLAARQGYAEAQSIQDAAAKAMTPAQIAEAQRMANDWHPSRK